MDTKQNTKQKGASSEALVDKFMQLRGWEVKSSNLLFRGGEIDRIYCYFNSTSGVWEYCFAEIKSCQWKGRQAQIFFLDSENFWKRFLKVKQLRNLLRAKTALSTRMLIEGKNSKTHIRIFLVLHFCNSKTHSLQFKNFKGPGKVCAYEDDFLIYSVEPQFSESRFERKTLLNIGI